MQDTNPFADTESIRRNTAKERRLFQDDVRNPQDGADSLYKSMFIHRKLSVLEWRLRCCTHIGRGVLFLKSCGFLVDPCTCITNRGISTVGTESWGHSSYSGWTRICSEVPRDECSQFDALWRWCC